MMSVGPDSMCVENRAACINKEPAQTVPLRTMSRGAGDAACFHDAEQSPLHSALIPHHFTHTRTSLRLVPQAPTGPNEREGFFF